MFEEKESQQIEEEQAQDAYWGITDTVLQDKEYNGFRYNEIEGKSEDQKEEFDWFNPFEDEEQNTTTHFVIVNNTRKTIKTGDQAFFCYGARTNKFLLLNYGFCFENNYYDAFQTWLRLDCTRLNPSVDKMIDRYGSSE